MGNLSFMQGWRPSTPPSPEEQLHQALLNAGLDAPAEVVLDGKIHRFGPKKTSWYIAFPDSIPAGRLGDWKDGIEQSWRADVGRELSPIESIAYANRLAEAKRVKEQEQQVIASTVEQIWQQCTPASAEHPYLQKKGVQPHQARVTGDGRLVLPVCAEDGILQTLQYIDADGNKLFHSGGKAGGGHTIIGSGAPAYLCEGYATGATIHEVTGKAVVVAYQAGNLPPVAKMYPGVTVVADNDESGTGERYAKETGCRYVMPPMIGDANDYAAAGGDLAALLSPANDWLVAADEFASRPAPLKWLIKGWIQDKALHMIHGPSGSGKTFVVLDWCLSIASKKSDWRGNTVHGGDVVYLAGEGHHGLKGRIAAWKEHHQVTTCNLWISKTGCDLNTPNGFMQVVDSIADMQPRLIVVDTLHRFLLGDENSAQDAKTMIDACAALMERYQCAVALVHHTGVSDEAQHRARGSSAWKGALDVEVSVVPPKSGERNFSIVQRKAKDFDLQPSEWCVLERVELPGWVDEDGEQVYSAVVAQGEGETPVANPNIKLFERIWLRSGRELMKGKPYLTKSAAVAGLEDINGLTHQTALSYVKPSKGRFISDLLNIGYIEAFMDGWVVVDKVHGPSMAMLS